jgi:hypothetical protein
MKRTPQKPLQKKEEILNQLRIIFALNQGVGATKIPEISHKEKEHTEHKEPEREHQGGKHDEKNGEHHETSRGEYLKLVIVVILQLVCAVIGLAIGLYVMAMPKLGAIGVPIALLLPIILIYVSGAILNPIFGIKEGH